jgi:hypothetical protein
MKKLIYIVIIGFAIGFVASCKNQDQITGPAGAQGVQGVQGGNLTPVIELGPNVLTPVQLAKQSPTNYYYYAQRLYGYNKNLNYAISAYVTKQDTGHHPLWYKLPYKDLFSANDEMYCSIGNDSIYLWYYNASTTPITAFADTNITYKIVILSN